MKKITLKLIALSFVMLFLNSCYTISYNVGKGAQTGIEVRGKNHYLIYGLANISSATPDKLAGSTLDYEVTITHTFIDGLINFLTGGIYTPTTTIVKK